MKERTKILKPLWPLYLSGKPLGVDVSETQYYTIERQRLFSVILNLIIWQRNN
jgi:hypothetical protein